MRAEFQILDDIIVHQIDDFSSFDHIATQPIRIPAQYRIVFTFSDVIEHLAKDKTLMRFFSRF